MSRIPLKLSLVFYVPLHAFLINFWLVHMIPEKEKIGIVKILNIGVDRSEITMQTQIRLLQKKQSDLGQHCCPYL